MVDPQTRNIMIAIYFVLIVSIAAVLILYMTANTNNSNTNDKNRKANTFDGHHPVPIGPSVPLVPPTPNPQPIPTPVVPDHHKDDNPPIHYPPRMYELVGPPDSYFTRFDSFNNHTSQTPCLRALIEKFRQLAHPLDLNFVDKGAYLQPLVANDKATIKATWERLCNAINTGIQTCPDMSVRYIVPQGSNEEIQFANDGGKVYIPEGSRFYCIDTRLYPIYFRLNHKGSGITFAINIPDFS